MRTPCAFDEAISSLLLSRATPGRPNECWEWPNATAPNGYGRQAYEGRAQYVHRLSFRAFNGPIPAGHNVCHRCDNPPCWNPAHLFAGSTATNVQDRDDKGRGYRGERHHSAKLTAEDVREIRASGLPGPQLARQYGVKFASIYKILGVIILRVPNQARWRFHASGRQPHQAPILRPPLRRR